MPPSMNTPPALQEATRNSTVAWQDNLKSLFIHAKDRFSDVVWELTGENDGDVEGVEEIWGHKGESILTSTSVLASCNCGSVYTFCYTLSLTCSVHTFEVADGNIRQRMLSGPS